VFHILAYNKTEGAADVNVDMVAVSDPIFSQRNSHFIFSEQYQLLAATFQSVDVTSVRLNMPSINAISRHHVFPLDPSATPSSFPRIADYRSAPIQLPLNEEMAWEESNSGAGGPLLAGFLFVAPTVGWNTNLPVPSPSNPRLLLKATGSYTSLAKAWSGPQTLTFEQTPRGGWYCVNAAYCQNSLARAFRLFFPRAQEFNGRILRPGMVENNANGNLIYPRWAESFGEWGRFHTFEPPQIEEYTDAAAAQSPTVFLDVTYLGSQPSY
jgi:hypothetical protein